MNTKKRYDSLEITSIENLNSKLINNIPNLNPFWILGFIEAEGSFYLSFDKPVFSIGQKHHSFDVLKA
jgi:hypothetical protein